MITSIPSVSSADEVAVVNLDGFYINARNFVTAAKDAPVVRVAGDEAQQIVTLWQGLPFDESARCHTPPFGLRFYAVGRLLCEASICWNCNNIYGEVSGERFFYYFNAESPSARRLLEILQIVSGSAGA